MVMLGIEYFGILNTIAFRKMLSQIFQSICDVIDDVIQIQVQILKSNDVIIVYF